MNRMFHALCAALALVIAAPAAANPALDSFARDVERTESVRDVKELQRLYAQYAQFGLWNEVGALFAPNATFTFDGMIAPAQISNGPTEISAFLRNRYGGGEEGLRAGGLSTMMIENPVVNLSPDGKTAKARWNLLAFHGHEGSARIEGGVIESDYALAGGKWTISAMHYFPQFDGPYEQGWTNWGGGDLPQVPHHFTIDSSGVPIPPAVGDAPRTKAKLAELQRRVDAMNDEDRVGNIQSAFGYYQDRKMWDDVVDLFADGGVVEVGGQGVWKGKAAIRRWLETMGPAGLTHGQLNDRPSFDVTVEIAPGGNEAWARGIELGMLGEADQEKGWWEVRTFANRFVREDGRWKIREMRIFPQMKTDIFQGWGKSRIVEPAPGGAAAPDARPSSIVPAGLAMPAFIQKHPVTGKPVKAGGDAIEVAAVPLTGAIAKAKQTPVGLEEAKRRLARSAAMDGIANVSAAYGYYVDDSMPRGFGGVIAEKGFKMSPFSGYYITRERVLSARVAGEVPQTRPGISYHWLIQPVVMISEDGRSATGRFRLFQPRTGKQVGKAGDFFGASFWGGMYHDQYVLENGVWRIWDLTLDEPYITPVAWKDGVWAKSKDPDPNLPKRKFTGGNFPPDIPLTALGKREEGFQGGTGEALQWPSIMPMWFQYANPVSGRVPELYQSDCVPCTVRPELRLDANGYQQPPDAPDANRSP